MRNVKEAEAKELVNSGKKVVMAFSATWCMPCRTLTPTLERVETTEKDVEFIKIDIEDESRYASEMGIRAVPTVLIYNNSDVKDRSSGARPESYYKDIITTL